LGHIPAICKSRYEGVFEVTKKEAKIWNGGAIPKKEYNKEIQNFGMVVQYQRRDYVFEVTKKEIEKIVLQETELIEFSQKTFYVKID
jgi:hypothetical protein